MWFARAERQPTVFFRDDDAGSLTPELRSVVELLLEERVPCNYVVVPAFLTRETAEYLRRLRAASPGLIEINQHGFLHEQVIRGRHQYSEFGGARPYAEQLAAIEEGRERLRGMFGDDLGAAIFTPPANKYDDNTLRAMREAGFTIHSGYTKVERHRRAVFALGRALGKTTLLGTPVSYHERAVPGLDMVELSPCIDVDLEPNLLGGTKVKTAKELWHELQRALSCQSIIGVMLHHATYKNAKKLDALREFVRRLHDERVTLATIETIARDLSLVSRPVRPDTRVASRQSPVDS